MTDTDATANVGDQITYRTTVKQIATCHCRNGDLHNRYRVGVSNTGRGCVDYVWLCELRIDGPDKRGDSD